MYLHTSVPTCRSRACSNVDRSVTEVDRLSRKTCFTRLMMRVLYKTFKSSTRSRYVTPAVTNDGLDHLKAMLGAHRRLDGSTTKYDVLNYIREA